MKFNLSNRSIKTNLYRYSHVVNERRHGINTPVLQETLENVLTATIALTSTLVVLEVISVT